MRPRDIDRFFTLLSREFHAPLKIFLTGGAVAVLSGSRRVTHDLDFQIAMKKNGEKYQEALRAAIEKATALTGIATQYDENIETWGSIAWPPRRPQARLYKRYGSVDVYLLDPLLWSIGKLSRYLTSDVEDLQTVLRRLRIPPRTAVRAWGEALGRSPMSSAQALFKRQALHFMRKHGPSIWCRKWQVQALEQLFLDSARQASYRKTA